MKFDFYFRNIFADDTYLVFPNWFTILSCQLITNINKSINTLHEMFSFSCNYNAIIISDENISFELRTYGLLRVSSEC